MIVTPRGRRSCAFMLFSVSAPVILRPRQRICQSRSIYWEPCGVSNILLTQMLFLSILLV